MKGGLCEVGAEVDQGSIEDQEEDFLLDQTEGDGHQIEFITEIEIGTTGLVWIEIEGLGVVMRMTERDLDPAEDIGTGIVINGGMIGNFIQIAEGPIHQEEEILEIEMQGGSLQCMEDLDHLREGRILPWEQ